MNNPWVQRTAWLGFGCRVFMSGLFLWSGGSKLLDPVGFARAIEGYQMVPQHVVVWMAWVVPWLETWIAVTLWVSPVFHKAAWGWIFGLLMVFTVAKVSAVVRGLDIQCGCTYSGTPLTWSSVLENLFYLLLTGMGGCWDRRFRVSGD